MKISKITLCSVALLASLSANSDCLITNLDNWSSVTNVEGNLTVTEASSMANTECGMAAATQAPGEGRAFVWDESPALESRFRGAFCMDPNNVSMPDNSSGTANRRMKVHNVRCDTSVSCTFREIVGMRLEQDAAGNPDPGNYQLKVYVRDQTGLSAGYTNSESKQRFDVSIPNQPTSIQYDLDIASGSFKMWVDAANEGDPRAVEITGLDMTDWAEGVGETRLGNLSGDRAITADQIINFDEAEFRRQSFIVQNCANTP